MPGGTVCSVATCKKNSKRSRETGEHLMFFTFPKEPIIKKEWIRKCYREEKWNCDKKRLCSVHFKQDDYEDELQARLLNLHPKKLKKDAIPSLFLPTTEEEIQKTEKAKRMLRKESKAVTEDLICEDAIESPYEICEKPNEDITDIFQIPSSSRETDFDILKKKLEIIEKENATLKQKIVDYENQEKLLKLKCENVGFEDKIKFALKDCLTTNQVDIALKKKSKARWTQEELFRAFTLRYFSKRSYIYLKETLHYPLPGLSTLQQWAANINLTNGILEDVLRIMDTVGKTKPNRFRTTVLSFDAVKVSALYEYYQKDDEIIGPHSYMLVIMVRGLFANWKQPVYIGFDQIMTKELLESVTIRLHDIKYNIVAFTCDCSSGNQGLWKTMGINMDNTFTEHAVTKKPIYFFADAPHLLESLRNWFINTGFILKDNIIINKDPVKSLLENTRSEINSCHKLTALHLNCEKTQGQNVKLAAQLFSNTTATALKHLPGDDKQTITNVAEFFQLVNNWFDIMNSYTPSSFIPTKKPYGTNLEMQNEILENMTSTVRGMICTGKKSLQIFQRGIIISIKSLQGLFTSMKQDYDIKYLLTHRLNQDSLDNFFCQIRSQEGLNDHPSPLNSIYRVRMILLGKNPELVTAHSIVETSPGLRDDEYLLISALKQAKLGQIEIPKEHSRFQMIDDKTDTDSTTSSSGSVNSRLSMREESEIDCLAYIAGYLAKKHNEKYPYLGKYTYQMNEAIRFHDYSMPSWIQSLSFGGLIDPSEECTRQVTKMDNYFQKLHKETFTYNKHILKKSSEYISKRMEDVPEELIKSFCRQRIYVRIKFLNLKREESKLTKRKAEPIRKTSNKIKKIVN